MFDRRLNQAAKSMDCNSLLNIVRSLGIKARARDRLFIDSLKRVEDSVEILPGEACVSKLPDRFKPINSKSYLFIYTETCEKMMKHDITQSLLSGEIPSDLVDKLLWISGPSGFGKSFILQYLVRLLRTSPKVKVLYISNPSLLFSDSGINYLESIIFEIVFSLAEDTGKIASFEEFLDKMAQHLNNIYKSQSMEDKLAEIESADADVKNYCISQGILLIKVLDQRNVIASAKSANGRTIYNSLKDRLEDCLISFSKSSFSIVAESVMSETIKGKIEKVDFEIDQCFSDASILKLRDEIQGKPRFHEAAENWLLLNVIVGQNLGRCPLLLRLFFEFLMKDTTRARQSESNIGLESSLNSLAQKIKDFIRSLDYSTIVNEQNVFLKEKNDAPEVYILLMIADRAPPLSGNGISLIYRRHESYDPHSKKPRYDLITEVEESALLSGSVSIEAIGEILQRNIQQEGPPVLAEHSDRSDPYVSLDQIATESHFKQLRNVNEARKYVNRKYMYIDDRGYVRCTSPAILDALKAAVIPQFMIEKAKEIKNLTLENDPIISGKALEAEFRANLTVRDYRGQLTLDLDPEDVRLKIEIDGMIRLMKSSAFISLFTDNITDKSAKICVPVELTFPLIDFAVIFPGSPSISGDIVPEIIPACPALYSVYTSLLSQDTPKITMLLMQMCTNYKSHNKADWKVINRARRGVNSSKEGPTEKDDPTNVYPLIDS